MTITRIAGETHRLEAAAARTGADASAWPAGLVSRTCLAAELGLTVVDVWVSRLALSAALDAGALALPWHAVGGKRGSVKVLAARLVETRPVDSPTALSASAA